MCLAQPKPLDNRDEKFIQNIINTWGTLTQSSAVRVGVRSTLPQLMTKSLRSHKASSSRRCHLHVRDLLNLRKGVISPDSKISPKKISCSDMFGPSQSRLHNSEALFHPTKFATGKSKTSIKPVSKSK